MNEITQKLVDLLGPITNERTHFSIASGEKVYPGAYASVEMSKVQRELAEKILKDHFNFKEIIWIKELGVRIEGRTSLLPVSTTKLNDDVNRLPYEGKTCYLYQIIFTPKMYDPKTMYEPVKDGCVLAPLLYNPETFVPKRSITITWNPEDFTDGSAINGFKLEKQILLSRLERVLDNPKEYELEGFRGAMVRMAVL